MLEKTVCTRAKVVVFGQKWLYLGKSGFILAKVVVFGQSACIKAKLLYSSKSCCIQAKWLYLIQK